MLSGISLLVALVLFFRLVYLSRNLGFNNLEQLKDFYKNKFGTDLKFSPLNPIQPYRLSMLFLTDKTLIIKEHRRKILFNALLVFIFGALALILQSNGL